MKMKKRLFAAVLLFTCASFIWSASASEQDEIHRSAGYRGSISLTDQYLFWVGFDTSHGWMFDEHHYLGGGVGFATVPDGFWPTIAHVFVDYSAYILKRPSTPTAGVKAGYMTSFGVLGDQRPLKDFGEMSVFEIEPNVGWSWAFNGDLGMRLSIGATVLVGSQWTTAVMPKLSVGFEF